MSSPPSDTRGTRRPGRRELVLRALKTSEEPLGIAAIARKLDVHPNTVRFHLEALTSAGQVEQVPTAPTGPGRPAIMYRALPGMDRTGPTHYRTLARILVEDIAEDDEPGPRAIAAGRRWGAKYASRMSAPEDAPEVARLLQMLEEFDFAPEYQPVDDERGVVGLRHCPFLDLVAEYPTVICPVHLGLMQGAMQTWQSGSEVSGLDPFAEPDMCKAHLRRIAPAGPEQEG